MELVLTEAVTNVMDYGKQPEGKIEISCTLLHECILIEIIDAGIPFDPTQVKPADRPQTLEDATPGGLGIHLIHHYTYNMHYQRKNGRNILRMCLPVQYNFP